MLSKYNIPFYLGILSIIISFYIIFLIIKSERKLEIFGLSLILGGALGNGLDRLVKGYVIDFIDFYIGKAHWPAFNLQILVSLLARFYFSLMHLKINENYAFQNQKVMVFIYLKYNKCLYICFIKHYI